MNYYINEYSLRGQFCDVDSFYKSLREYTVPVLDQIEANKGGLIWKKDTFWQSEICRGIPLNNIPRKRNERDPDMARLQIKLIKLMYEDPYWSEDDECDFEVQEYKFDLEHKDYFSKVNCFTKGIHDEGRIISFIHNSYMISKLGILVNREGTNFTCELDNIISREWWKKEPAIQTWRIEQRYIVEVRANEFDYHPPHFHVTFNEFSAVFRLSDG